MSDSDSTSSSSDEQPYEPPAVVEVTSNDLEDLKNDEDYELLEFELMLQSLSNGGEGKTPKPLTTKYSSHDQFIEMINCACLRRNVGVKIVDAKKHPNVVLHKKTVYRYVVLRCIKHHTPRKNDKRVESEEEEAKKCKCEFKIRLGYDNKRVTVTQSSPLSMLHCVNDKQKRELIDDVSKTTPDMLVMIEKQLESSTLHPNADRRKFMLAHDVFVTLPTWKALRQQKLLTMSRESLGTKIALDAMCARLLNVHTVVKQLSEDKLNELEVERAFSRLDHSLKKFTKIVAPQRTVAVMSPSIVVDGPTQATTPLNNAATIQGGHGVESDGDGGDNTKKRKSPDVIEVTPEPAKKRASVTVVESED